MATPAEHRSVSALLSQHPLREASAGARKISYRCAGEGPPVVLLHGIGSTSASWVYQLEGLAAGFRVIAWDAPGYGLSSPFPDPSPAAAEYADTLAALLDTLQASSCILVGQSLGAIIAASFAAHRPDRVRGLVLLGPANGYGRADAETRAQMLNARLQAIDGSDAPSLADERAPAMLSAGAPAEALELVRLNMGQLRADGYAQAARLLAYGWLADDAPRYSGATLIACGGDDRITPVADCQAIAAAFKHGEFRVLPGLGHAAYAEDPLAVNELITQFTHRCAAVG